MVLVPDQFSSGSLYNQLWRTKGREGTQSKIRGELEFSQGKNFTVEALSCLDEAHLHRNN